MKKFITLLLLIVPLLVHSAPTALANDTKVSAVEGILVANLVKSMDRKIIDELYLNEMQYIRLKSLSKQYLKDIAISSNFTALDQAALALELEQISQRYYTGINSVLSEYQISLFMQLKAVAIVK